MNTTPNLALPYLQPNQAQKHVTHAEGLALLDAVVQLAVISAAQTTPPVSPAEGDRYILPAGAQDGWTGKDGAVAAWIDGAWLFLGPVEGWQAWVEDESGLQVFTGGVWQPMPAGRTTDRLGINASADPFNRLAVSSDAALFTHAGSDQKLFVNRAAGADTASLVFQTGFETGAEIGLAGEDALILKVGAPGEIPDEAMRLKFSPASGKAQCLMGTATPLDDNAALEIHRAGATANFNRTAGSGGVMMGFYHQDALRGQVSVGATGSLYLSGEPDLILRADGQNLVSISADAADFSVPARLERCLLASMPDAAASGSGAIVFAADATPPQPVYSDGSAWRYVADATLV